MLTAWLYKFLRTCLLAATCMVGTGTAYAQGYSYINYDVKDGLPASVVYDAVQDREGFMWFATENGLCRFDGKRFTTFTTRDGLPDNEIIRLYTDAKGRVWIIPFRNEICYYYKGRIYNAANDTLLRQLHFSSYVKSILEDGNGLLYIGDGRDQYFTIDAGNRIRVIATIGGVAQTVYQLLQHKGQVYTLFNHFNDPPEVFRVYNPRTGVSHTFNDRLGSYNSTVHMYAENKFLIAQRDTLFFVDNRRVPLSMLHAGGVSSINPVKPGFVMINNSQGAIMFDVDRAVGVETFLQGIAVNRFFIDAENNYWFCTRGKGIFRLPSQAFRNYAAGSFFNDAGIHSSLADGDRLLLGTGKSHLFQLKAGVLTNVPIQEQALPGSVITAITVIENTIQVGTDKNIRLASRLAPLFHPTATAEIAVKSLQSVNGNLLQGVNSGVGLFDRAKHVRIVWTGRTTCAISTGPVFYIGTLNGLLVINDQKQDTSFPGRRYRSLNGRISQLALGHNGLVWVGTKGEGIIGYRGDSIVYHLTDSNGLTSNNCSALFVQGDTVWAGTEKGLNRVVVKGREWQVTRYTLQDGLASDIINTVAVYNRRVYVGSPAGLTYFNPDSVAAGSLCRLQFTGIFINDRYWAYDSTGFSLAPSDNDIRFDFSGIAFKAAGEISYRYRLVGLHDDWRNTDETLLAFPSLPAGSYTLQVEAINKFGVSSGVKEIKFEVRKRFWEQTLVRLSALLVLALLARFYLKYRVKKLREKEARQREIEHRMAELEQTALRSQMNPHFIFNSLNSIQQYVAERDIEGANRFITDFSRLIRMTLDLSSQTQITLRQECLYLETYLRLERTRLEHDFDYQVEEDALVDMDEVTLPPLLLQPYAENSIRHGIRYKAQGKGLITIRISRVAAGVMISVEDNGIGREASRQYKSGHHVQYQSKGMSISQGRAELLNRIHANSLTITVVDLYDSNDKAAGTRVDVLIPDMPPDTDN